MTKMTKEECRELASQCANRGYFHKNFRRAYDLSNEEGWLDEFLPLLPIMTKEEKKEGNRIASAKYRKNNPGKVKVTQAKYRMENPEKIKSSAAKHYKNNPEKMKAKSANRRKNNPDEVKANNVKFRKNNPSYNQEYYSKPENRETIHKCARKNYKKRRKKDVLFRLSANIRSSIRRGFKNNEFKKNSRTEMILGCTFEEFIKCIVPQWEPWMNWDNYGKYSVRGQRTWCLDHIVPVCSAKTLEDLIALNHYSNFRPFCSKANLDKAKEDRKLKMIA